MRSTVMVTIVLVTFFPVAGLSSTNNYLINTDLGPHARVSAVSFAEEGSESALKWYNFGKDGGWIDPDTQEIRGIWAEGTEATVPLAKAARLKVRLGRAGYAHQYTTSFDAIRKDPAWPPKGRIRRVVLTDGVVVDFDLVAPGLDMAERRLFWSCAGKSATQVPLAEVAMLQIELNSFVINISDLADFCVVTAVDMFDGQHLDTTGRPVIFDPNEEAIHSDGQVIPLAAVGMVRIGDCRRAEHKIVPVPPVQALSEPKQVEVFDLGAMRLLGEKVRWREVEGRNGWTTGRVIEQDARQFKVRLGPDTLTVAAADLERIQTSRGYGSNAGRGAAIGAAVVGLASLAAGMAFMANDFFEVSSGEVVGGMFLGAFSGAAVGGLIGHLSKTEKWEEVPKVNMDLAIVVGHRPGLAVKLQF